MVLLGCEKMPAAPKEKTVGMVVYAGKAGALLISSDGNVERVSKLDRILPSIASVGNSNLPITPTSIRLVVNKDEPGYSELSKMLSLNGEKAPKDLIRKECLSCH